MRNFTLKYSQSRTEDAYRLSVQHWGRILSPGLRRFSVQDWGCVILREIDFLLKFCWSIPCLHPSWKVHTWIEICASLNHRQKTKADGSRLIPRKHTETLVLLSVTTQLCSRCCQNSTLYVNKGGYTSNCKIAPAAFLHLMAKYTLPFSKPMKSDRNKNFWHFHNNHIETTKIFSVRSSPDPRIFKKIAVRSSPYPCSSLVGK